MPKSTPYHLRNSLLVEDTVVGFKHFGKRIIQEIPETQDSNISLETDATMPIIDVGNEGQAPATAKKKSTKALIIGAVVIVIIIVAILLSSLIGGNSTKGSNIYQEANFNNGAKFAYDDKRLYIIGLYDEDDKDTSLYSTDYKGVNKKLISDNGSIVGIRVIDKKIYYKAIKSQKHAIGMMNRDGTDDTSIVTSSSSIGKYDIYNNTLYYLKDSSIHACTLNGQDDTVVVEDVDTFTVCRGYLYYVDSKDVISSYKLKNGKIAELCKSSGATALSVDGNVLYFKCDSGLSSVSLDKNHAVTKVIRDDSLINYVFYDGCIYYSHQMTLHERKEIAEYFAETSSDVKTYQLALVGTGSLYRSELIGGDGVPVDNTNQTFVSLLYTYPDGMYCITSVWSNSIEQVEFD